MNALDMQRRRNRVVGCVALPRTLFCANPSISSACVDKPHNRQTRQRAWQATHPTQLQNEAVAQALVKCQFAPFVVSAPNHEHD